MSSILRFLTSRWGPIITGTIVGILAPVLVTLGNPGNMGIQKYLIRIDPDPEIIINKTRFKPEGKQQKGVIRGMNPVLADQQSDCVLQIIRNTADTQNFIKGSYSFAVKIITVLND